MPKVLLVEDNREIRESVAQYLHMEGYEVDTCFDGICALEKGVNPKYDIILLDVMLPEIDGFRVAQKLIHKVETPMIMITAKESIEDKLTGFESGAVDYLVKPFDLRELIARIQSVLGRSIKWDQYTRGEVSVDLKKRRFTFAGKEVHLTQKEYLIVEILLEKKWEVVTRSDIIEYVWGDEALFENDARLDVYISTLRMKFGKSFISTVKGVGYQVHRE